MTEYWSNFYLRDGVAMLGLQWETRDHAQANQFLPREAAYRIHVKLKEQSK